MVCYQWDLLCLVCWAWLEADCSLVQLKSKADYSLVLVKVYILLKSWAYLRLTFIDIKGQMKFDFD